MISRIRERSQGQVLVIFALSAVAMFGIAALAIDGGRMLMDQRALQNAIDGAALDGAINLGPSAGATQSANAEDDAVLDIERDLGISFSTNYSGYGPHRITGGGCGGAACQPPYAAGTITWWDNSNAYKVTITTPFNYNGSENEAYIKIHISHNFSLLVASEFFPTIPVDAEVVARNYDLPFAIYTLKYYDPQDYQQAGSNTLQADKQIGTNGSVSSGGSATMTIYCAKMPNGSYNYGGNLIEAENPTDTPAAAHLSGIGGGCTTDTPFPGAGSPAATVATGSIQAPPPVRLPQDPYGSALTPTPVSYTVSGTEYLQPTIPGTPGGSYGPRYGTVTVPNSAVLYLEPGVYFFEGITVGSGLQDGSGGEVLTGDCYNSTLPNCWTPGSGTPAICTGGFGAPGVVATQLGTTSSSVGFPCPKDGDFGVLLVFYPHGTDSTSTCLSTNPLDANTAHKYCGYAVNPLAVAGDNQFDITSGASIYISSSPKYHNVAVYVDPSHEQGSSGYNYTLLTNLNLAGYTTVAQAMEVGVGSQVVYSVGGGSISVIGCILAPDDNIEIGGGGSGKGYGQIISYTLYLHGNGTINEGYNPLSLAYEPVIVR
jgi:hypothetical protein